MLPPEACRDLVARLRKIEGKTQGIQRMLAEGRDCSEVMNQLASVRAATRQVSIELTRYHIMSCLDKPGRLDSEKMVEDLIKFICRV